jgi:hypothetical protein
VKIGERVRHLTRDDVGIGEIVAIYPDGRCDALFRSCTFSGVPLSTFASVELEEQERVRKEMLLKEIRRRLRSDFLSADSYFRASCTELISVTDFEQEKISFVKSGTHPLIL